MLYVAHVSPFLGGPTEPGDLIDLYRARCGLIGLGGHAQGLLDRILLGSIRTKVLRGAT